MKRRSAHTSSHYPGTLNFDPQVSIKASDLAVERCGMHASGRYSPPSIPEDHATAYATATRMPPQKKDPQKKLYTKEDRFKEDLNADRTVLQEMNEHFEKLISALTAKNAQHADDLLEQIATLSKSLRHNDKCKQMIRKVFGRPHNTKEDEFEGIPFQHLALYSGEAMDLKPFICRITYIQRQLECALDISETLDINTNVDQMQRDFNTKLTQDQKLTKPQKRRHKDFINHLNKSVFEGAKNRLISLSVLLTDLYSLGDCPNEDEDPTGFITWVYSHRRAIQGIGEECSTMKKSQPSVTPLLQVMIKLRNTAAHTVNRPEKMAADAIKFHKAIPLLLKFIASDFKDPLAIEKVPEILEIDTSKLASEANPELTEDAKIQIQKKVFDYLLYALETKEDVDKLLEVEEICLPKKVHPYELRKLVKHVKPTMDPDITFKNQNEFVKYAKNNHILEQEVAEPYLETLKQENIKTLFEEWKDIFLTTVLNTQILGRHVDSYSLTLKRITARLLYKSKLEDALSGTLADIKAFSKEAKSILETAKSASTVIKNFSKLSEADQMVLKAIANIVDDETDLELIKSYTKILEAQLNMEDNDPKSSVDGDVSVDEDVDEDVDSQYDAVLKNLARVSIGLSEAKADMEGFELDYLQAIHPTFGLPRILKLLIPHDNLKDSSKQSVDTEPAPVAGAAADAEASAAAGAAAPHIIKKIRREATFRALLHANKLLFNYIKSVDSAEADPMAIEPGAVEFIELETEKANPPLTFVELATEELIAIVGELIREVLNHSDCTLNTLSELAIIKRNLNAISKARNKIYHSSMEETSEFKSQKDAAINLATTSLMQVFEDLCSIENESFSLTDKVTALINEGLFNEALDIIKSEAYLQQYQDAIQALKSDTELSIEQRTIIAQVVECNMFSLRETFVTEDAIACLNLISETLNKNTHNSLETWQEESLMQNALELLFNLSVVTGNDYKNEYIRTCMIVQSLNSDTEHLSSVAASLEIESALALVELGIMHHSHYREILLRLHTKTGLQLANSANFTDDMQSLLMIEFYLAHYKCVHGITEEVETLVSTFNAKIEKYEACFVRHIDITKLEQFKEIHALLLDISIHARMLRDILRNDSFYDVRLLDNVRILGEKTEAALINNTSLLPAERIIYKSRIQQLKELVVFFEYHQKIEMLDPDADPLKDRKRKAESDAPIFDLLQISETILPPEHHAALQELHDTPLDDETKNMLTAAIYFKHFELEMQAREHAESFYDTAYDKLTAESETNYPNIVNFLQEYKPASSTPQHLPKRRRRSSQNKKKDSLAFKKTSPPVQEGPIDPIQEDPMSMEVDQRQALPPDSIREVLNQCAALEYEPHKHESISEIELLNQSIKWLLTTYNSDEVDTNFLTGLSDLIDWVLTPRKQVSVVPNKCTIFNCFSKIYYKTDQPKDHRLIKLIELLFSEIEACDFSLFLTALNANTVESQNVCRNFLLEDSVLSLILSFGTPNFPMDEPSENLSPYIVNQIVLFICNNGDQISGAYTQSLREIIQYFNLNYEKITPDNKSKVLNLLPKFLDTYTNETIRPLHEGEEETFFRELKKLITLLNSTPLSDEDREILTFIQTSLLTTLEVP